MIEAAENSSYLRPVSRHRWELMLQFSQALLETVDVCVPFLAFGTTCTALQELHLHGQLIELKVLPLLPQVNATTNRTILRAQGC